MSATIPAARCDDEASSATWRQRGQSHFCCQENWEKPRGVLPHARLRWHASEGKLDGRMSSRGRGLRFDRRGGLGRRAARRIDHSRSLRAADAVRSAKPSGRAWPQRTCGSYADRSVASHEHCKLLQHEGQIIVRDLDSKNGVLCTGFAYWRWRSIRATAPHLGPHRDHGPLSGRRTGHSTLAGLAAMRRGAIRPTRPPNVAGPHTEELLY